jgi:hypothetical protein
MEPATMRANLYRNQEKPSGWQPPPEYGHFMTCPACGEVFDCRDLGQVLKHWHGGGMTQYYLRVTRGPMSRTEIVESAKDALDRANQLAQEGYDTIELRTPDGKGVSLKDLPALIGEQKRKARQRTG